MKLKISVAIVLVLAMMAAANSQTKRVRTKVPPHYESAWKEYLGEIHGTTEIQQLKEKLREHTLMTGYVPQGESGHPDWIFRVDDAHEIVVSVTSDGLVNGRPKLRPARKWLRYPDGSLEELHYGVVD